MIYAKFMPGRKLDFASRNKRELQAAFEYGYQVLVISSDENTSFSEKFPDYNLISDHYSIHVTYEMSRLRRYVRILWGYLIVIFNLRRVKVDVMSCHDIDSLFLAWTSYFLKSRKPTLIYDSHEFELGRNAKRNRMQRWFVSHLERFLMKRCAFSIMVNDAIADEVQQIHGLSQRPIVIRSTPNIWRIDEAECDNTRKEVFSSMSEPHDLLLMYHGGVLPGRGVETLLEVVANNEFTCLLVLGNGEDSYIKLLKSRAEDLGVFKRVLFHPAVPINELWRYVGAADIGMVTIPAIAKSYFYMLPNKFFENIQSETPVICSDFPAVAPIVRKYNIGLVCDPANVESISACINVMHSNTELYKTFKRNLKKAKEDLCWENEKQVLIGAFGKFLDKTS